MIEPQLNGLRRGAQEVFMRDRVMNRIEGLAPPPRWHERPVARIHLALVLLAALAALNVLALVPIG